MIGEVFQLSNGRSKFVFLDMLRSVPPENDVERLSENLAYDLHITENDVCEPCIGLVMAHVRFKYLKCGDGVSCVVEFLHKVTSELTDAHVEKGAWVGEEGWECVGEELQSVHLLLHSSICATR